MVEALVLGVCDGTKKYVQLTIIVLVTIEFTREKKTQVICLVPNVIITIPISTPLKALAVNCINVVLGLQKMFTPPEDTRDDFQC